MIENGLQPLGSIGDIFCDLRSQWTCAVPLLHKLKFGQSIRDCGPQAPSKKEWHTDNGRIDDTDCRSGCSAGMVQADAGSFDCLLLTFGHALIGFVDDYIKVVMKRNLGLTAKQKLFLHSCWLVPMFNYLDCSQHVIWG